MTQKELKQIINEEIQNNSALSQIQNAIRIFNEPTYPEFAKRDALYKLAIMCFNLGASRENNTNFQQTQKEIQQSLQGLLRK